MRVLNTLAAAVAVSLTLNACASSGASSSASLAAGPLPDGAAAGLRHGGTSAPAAQPATLTVSNYNWMDVVVYAVQGGSRVRLGQVTTMGTASFRLPTRMVNTAETVRLMVDPIGSTQGWQTEGISVHSGELVQFNVQNSLALSSVMIGR